MQAHNFFHANSLTSRFHWLSWSCHVLPFCSISLNKLGGPRLSHLFEFCWVRCWAALFQMPFLFFPFLCYRSPANQWQHVCLQDICFTISRKGWSLSLKTSFRLSKCWTCEILVSHGFAFNPILSWCNNLGGPLQRVHCCIFTSKRRVTYVFFRILSFPFRHRSCPANSRWAHMFPKKVYSVSSQKAQHRNWSLEKHRANTTPILQ